jgi:hypothetical protein
MHGLMKTVWRIGHFQSGCRGFEDDQVQQFSFHGTAWLEIVEQVHVRGWAQTWAMEAPPRESRSCSGVKLGSCYP